MPKILQDLMQKQKNKLVQNSLSTWPWKLIRVGFCEEREAISSWMV